MPKVPALVDKINDINRLVNRSWTELELAEKLDRQKTLRVKYSGIERERLQKSLDDSKAAGNEAKAAKLQEELDQLETPRLAFKTSLTPAKKNPEQQGEGLSQQERLAALNRENRRRNAEAVRQAQLKERARARETEVKIERGEAVEEDHSRRLRTKAKFLHDANEHASPSSRQNSGASTPAAAGGAASSAASTPVLGAQKQHQQPMALLPHLAKLQLQQKNAAGNRGGIPTIHKPLMDDDIIGALDLDIDVDID